MQTNLEIKGLDALMSHLKKGQSLKRVQEVVKKNGAELTEVMQKKAHFKGHMEGNKFVKPTGYTRRSINLVIKEAGMTAVVAPHSEYSPYLEYGTRFMASQPFVNPAFNYQKLIFLKQMKELVR